MNTIRWIRITVKNMSRGLRRWLSKYIIDIIIIIFIIILGVFIAWIMREFGGVRMTINTTTGF